MSARSPGRRLPQRSRLHLHVAAACLALSAGAPAFGATFTVDSVLDTADASPGNGVAEDASGNTSFRAAFEEAAALGGTHTIAFDAALVADGDVAIELSGFDTGLDSGEFGPTAFILPAGLTLTLSGPMGDDGVTLRRANGSQEFRLFHVRAGASLSVQRLALADGVARGGDGADRGAGGGGAAGIGGGILNQGSLQLSGVTLSNHAAVGGNGVNGASTSDGGGGGGGTGADGSDANNTTGGTGGAPNGGTSNNGGGDGGGGGGGNGRSAAGSQTANPGGTGGLFGGGGGGGSVLATGGVSTGTEVAQGGAGGAGGFGGGGGGGGGARAFNYPRFGGTGGPGGFGGGAGSVGGTDPSNQPPAGDGGGGAGFGGAVFNHGGTVVMRNTTISASTALGGNSGFAPDPYGGGGLGPGASGGAGSGFGGAIFSTNRGATAASLDLRHVTVAGSTVGAGQALGAAGSASGAIYVLGNAGTSSLALNNSLVGDTSGGTNLVVTTINAGSAPSSGTGNLVQSQSGFGGTIVSSADPQLVGLADNRGPTPTHALDPASPAVDTGDAGQTGGLLTDQRGGDFARVADGDLDGSVQVDIGAYELIQIDYGDAPDYLPGTGPNDVLLENGSDDLRISSAGTNGDTARGAVNPALAYNASADEFLVVWQADDNANDNEFEIWGRRVDADTLAPLGSDFRISTTGTDGDVDRDASNAAVAWSSVENEYLVVWQGDNEATDNDQEIYGRFVSAAGGLLGSQIRITAAGVDGETTAQVLDPQVAYSQTSNEFLVIWRGDDTDFSVVDNEFEVFGRRYDADTRAAAAAAFQISLMGGANGADANFDAASPTLAWNSTNNRFLVAWTSDDTLPGMVDNEFEVFGRAVLGGGGTSGTQFRISFMGPAGDTQFSVGSPSVGYNPLDNEFLVAWHAEDNNNGLVDGKFEIFAQRFAGANSAVQGGRIQVSQTGIPGDVSFDATNPSVSFGLATGSWLVAWQGDDLSDNDTDIFSRRLGADGTLLDIRDIRLSTMGPDGSNQFFAGNPDAAFGSLQGNTLVVWQGDDDRAPLVDGETEVFGQFVTDTPLVDYQTRAADGGPLHILELGLRLGAQVDSDGDGLRSLEADGDDLDNIDDEDGAPPLVQYAALAPQIPVIATNTTGAAATLYGWIDYDGDGLFENATERGSVAVPSGSSNAGFQLVLPAPPPGAVLNSFARFRLSSDAAAANPTGVAAGGEVEDYPAINNIDTVPDPFDFVDQFNVARSTVLTSAPLGVAGINSPTPISVTGGSYSINGGSFTTAAGSVLPDDQVRARHTSSASFSTTTDTVVTIGGVQGTFTSQTAPPDTTPDQFTFVDQVGVATSATITSAAITVQGIDSPAPISVTGGSYSINGAGFTAVAGSVSAGDQVRARHQSSAAENTTVNTVVSIGGVPDTFSSTTRINGLDASVTKSNPPGLIGLDQGTTWTIVVGNAGTDPIVDATVSDVLPPIVASANWICLASGGATCTVSGSGAINDTVDLPVGSSVTYTLAVSFVENAGGSVSNTVTVSVGGGQVDIDAGNNTAVDDSDFLRIFADGLED